MQAASDEARRGIEASARFAAGIGASVLTIHLFVPMDPGTYRDHGTLEVPLHIRNAPTKLMKELGHGKAYRYAHDEPHGYAAGENYFPDGVRAKFYRPTDRGLEIRIGEKLPD